jgi:hypothetical protein
MYTGRKKVVVVVVVVLLLLLLLNVKIRIYKTIILTGGVSERENIWTEEG